MITLFALLTTALLASPVHAGYPPPPGPWTAAAWRPLLDPRGPVFTSSAIQANGGRFWIGKEPSAYCPANVTALDCADYPGGKTVFTGGNETLFLDVAVPGGQQVFIAPDGALGYTPPHSTSMPEGSALTGWTRVISDAGGAPTVLGFQQRQIVGCPVGDEDDHVFQVFVAIDENVSIDGCLPFSTRTYTADRAVAWEY